MLTKISFTDSELMSSVRVILASVSSSEENRLSERETMRVLRRESGKVEYSECFEGSSECREHESDLMTIIGIQVSE
jgi:hypothetical protein